MRFKNYFAFGFLLALIAGSNYFLSGEQSKKSVELFHTQAERTLFQSQSLIPLVPGEYFLSSEHCRGCHGYDSARAANIDEDSNSVNLFDHWQGTMMANSARDPFWRAKVSHEILVDTAHALAIQDVCTSCHAPMGKYNSLFHGIAHYGLDSIATDSLGQDGVSCASCHTIGNDVGQTFSGIIPYDTTRTIYGPFTNPVSGPMQLYEGYTPVYGAHMDESRICSSCHTLFTQTIDTNGNYTGGVFPEQATYHEYLNSQFPANNITCQSCHMPRLDDAIIIANGFASLQPRYPFNQHTFAGANSFMITLIKNNKVALGSSVEDWKYDSTIAATHTLLREHSLEFSLQLDSLSNDTGFFRVRLENKAGHKFPSGYPSRRVVIQLVVIDAAGDTVFHSGTFTNDYRVVGETPGFEPHHDIIRQPGVPQIYELAIGDVNGNFTSVLGRAAMLLKDNRIPPAGFTTLSPVYDTVTISADALSDSDFNQVNSIEGSGADVVHYHVPIGTAAGNIRVYAQAYYQAVPPKWVDEMFLFSSAEIDSFEVMYNNADRSPLLVKSDSLINIGLSVSQRIVEDGITVYPTVSTDGKVFVKARSGLALNRIEIFSQDGKKVIQATITGGATFATMTLPAQKIVYLMKIQAGGKIFYRKVIRH